ncbi:MAG TPA: ribosome biogenesis GTPase Der [Candidatus Dormibacteraeota bacterium]|nr:ribosome biogenesis GTPase Der [Candidatus Dormibacteraeota bacterium]
MAVTPLVAIVGRPNVGKSSLFNRLVGQRQAITHEQAGTTRDPNYGYVSWGKKHFLAVDTAGLQKGKGEMEAKVQDQVASVADIADLFVVAVDAGTMITDADRQAAKLALKTGKPVILAINKIDTAGAGLGDSFNRLGIREMIETSAIHGRGSGDLLDAISAHLPEGRAPEPEDKITLALLGRPNVGKSSLLNSLVGKQKTVVSEAAGTTRDVTSAEIKYHGQTIELLDTAGLRRRGKIEPGVEKFSSLRTLAAIARADIGVVLINATELSVAGDQHIAGDVAEAGRGLILVVNKWDLPEKDDKTQSRYTRKLVGDFAFVPWAPLVYTSATQGLNVTKLFELAVDIGKRRQQKISTAKLNNLIQELVAKQPPAGLRGKRPKINYATQIDTAPPTFAIFCTYPELVHFSYQRYLENGIRQQFDFSGTPIKIEFRNKRKDD